MKAKLIISSLCYVQSVTASDLRNTAEFHPDTRAQCSAQVCGHIGSLANFTNCMSRSTTPCFGTLEVSIWGHADTSTFCKRDLNSRLYYSFQNVPFTRSVFFTETPIMQGSALILFSQQASEICYFWLLGAETDGLTNNADTCGLPPLSTSAVKLALPQKSQQLTIVSDDLYRVSADRAGFAAMGTSSNCGGSIDSVSYDGISYTVSVDNRVNSSSHLFSLSAIIFYAYLLHIFYGDGTSV